MAWDEQRVSFGATATTYDANRPDWPAATAAWLAGIEDGGPLLQRAAERGLDVLDLGAGTGKLTRTLVEAGHRVTAVDPSEGMLAVLSATLPQVTALIGAAEELPMADRRMDVVTLAQAWHWVDQEAAGVQIARVLRPGGLLALAWHVRQLTEPWMSELDLLTGNPQFQEAGSVRSSNRAINLPEQFGPVQTAEFSYRQQMTPAGLVDLASTWSYVAIRPDRDAVLVEVEAIGRRAADADGLLTIPHLTHCYRSILGEG